MERADVLIVGGGPAGSSCAAVLKAAGCDCVVVDAAAFPRDKPCAGWITPEVLEEIPFSLESYADQHVAQPVSRFRVGTIGGGAVEVDYGAPVSFGIRRTEFDAELLLCSGARIVEGERVQTIERRNGAWVLNGRLTAPVLVGAGGHFCPVARHTGGPPGDADVVVARETEFPLSGEAEAGCAVEPDRPELYFCRDLRGYGWCFRKDGYLNVGLGRLDGAHLPAHLDAFLEFLRRQRRIGPLPAGFWRGHAYRIRTTRARPVSGDSLVLVGDAAGLAAAASGEGILPARLSGRIAAELILESRLADYESKLEERLGPRSTVHPMVNRLAGVFAPLLLGTPGIARRVVLDRWFLHRRNRPRATPFSGDPRGTRARALRASRSSPGR